MNTINSNNTEQKLSISQEIYEKSDKGLDPDSMGFNGKHSGDMSRTF